MARRLAPPCLFPACTQLNPAPFQTMRIPGVPKPADLGRPLPAAATACSCRTTPLSAGGFPALLDKRGLACLGVQVTRTFPAHSYAIASWSPNITHPSIPDITNLPPQVRPPRHAPSQGTQGAHSTAAVASQGVESYVGEFFKVPALNQRKGGPNGCHYTCIVALSGVPAEQVAALEVHLAGKLTHMHEMLLSPEVQKLLAAIVAAVEQVRYSTGRG